MSNDATDTLDTSQQDTDSGEDSTQQDAGTSQQDSIASMRKRQAGAEAARQAAEARAQSEAARAAQLQAQLDALNAAAQGAEVSELAREKALRESAETRAAEAEAKAQAKILDTLYPNARKELPEVTDEVRLAKFEAMLRDDEEADDLPIPRGNNGPKGSGSADTKPPTIAELEKSLAGQLTRLLGGN